MPSKSAEQGRCAVIVVMAGSLIAAACSSSTDDSSATDATTNTTPPPAAATSESTATTTTPTAAVTTTADTVATAGTTAAALVTIADVPAVFEGERVAVIGSNAWPLVGNLLALGVTPAAIYSQLGNQEQPGYLTESFGEELAEVPVQYVDLASLNPEELARVGADRVVLPAFFEPIIADNPIWQQVIDGGAGAVYVPATDWRGSLQALVDASGVDASATLAELDAEYDVRVEAIADSLDYDPSPVTFNTFQWNEDGTFIPTLRAAPIVQVMSDLGFQLHPSLAESNDGPVSLETVPSMDADLVAIQVRGVEYDSLAADPLWSTTSAATSGNQFERFQFGQQGGWLEMLALLDQLAVELPRYQPVT